jgi:hypothetical protein
VAVRTGGRRWGRCGHRPITGSRGPSQSGGGVGGAHTVAVDGEHTEETGNSREWSRGAVQWHGEEEAKREPPLALCTPFIAT